MCAGSRTSIQKRRTRPAPSWTSMAGASTTSTRGGGAAVLGQSMGGAIAMWLALHRPERVERLILVDSATVKEMQRARSLGGVLNPLIPLAAPFTLRRG